MLLNIFNGVRPTFPRVSRLFRDVRPGLREYLLRAHLPIRSQRGIGAEIEARLCEADRLCEMLGQRHIRAYHAEKQGHNDDAIKLYEENVADGDLSTLSYERLRILYTKENRQHEAIRICKSYLRAVDELAELDPHLPAWIVSNRTRISQHLVELNCH